MNTLHLTSGNEQRLFEQGHDCVAGVDEAGRGPLAGPVVAAAVAIWSVVDSLPDDVVVRDSKTMTALQREAAYAALTAEDGISWGVGVIDHATIDDIGIVPATRQAMETAVAGLLKRPSYVFVDDARIVLKELGDIEQESLARADATVWVCAAASIIAKVTRDRLMVEEHKRYSQYGFDRHKGYGTQAHYAALAVHGPCRIHRRSFL